MPFRSIRHGIITPYPSFLADDNVRLADRSNVNRAAESTRRSLSLEAGRSGVEQRAFKAQLQSADNASAVSGPVSAPTPSASGLSGGAREAAADADKRSRAVATEKKEVFKGVRVVDESGAVKSLDSVRQLGQKTFFRKNKMWQDSTVTDEQQTKAIRLKQFSREYFDLAA